ncbi:hypothetical protein MHY_15530 [Megamonas hypermegale ART12/1]|nr:hypothetical protein MHY_15530 [Megamonas hypermegale ART12/1]
MEVLKVKELGLEAIQKN